MSRRGPRSAPIGLLLVATLTLVACTRPENSVSDTATTLEATAGGDTTTTSTSTGTTDVTNTTAAPTTAPETTAPPTTAPDTTAAPGTTAPTTPPTTAERAPLTLIFDGIVPFRFGDRDIDVVPGLAESFGEPVRDDLVEYPTADDGVFLDASGEQSFVAPFGRTVCFDNGLCVQFGAGAPETLIFTGWRLDGSGPSDLVTEDGIAIGSTLADHADDITFDPAVSCFQVAYGAADGIDVTLDSADGPFATPNADGDGLDIGDPDPNLVTVQSMSAGELPVFLLDDC